MNVTASIQARMSSSRLPGKVLMDVCGKPMLKLQIERIRRSRLVDRVIVGTSNSKRDDEIEDFCLKNEIDCYRGSEDDVLKRISSLVSDLNVDIHVECYGDSPLIDPQLIDEFIGCYMKSKDQADYFSSALKTTYPPGLEISVYQAKILLEVNNIVADDDPMREHVGFNITRFPQKFRLMSLEAPPWFHYPDVYLEVDTIEDLTLLRSIVGHFVERGQEHFSLAEILNLINDNPSLLKQNFHIERRWKALREGKHI